MKLTPKQNAVIWCLQNGWILITDNGHKGALVAGDKSEYHINNGLFWRLVKMGLIYQRLGYPFDYVLTIAGEEIKTNPVKF